MMNAEAKAQLSAHACEEIDQWIAKFPEGKQRSAVIAALHIVQHENQGYLTPELMNAVAEYLNLPPVQVYEVATFYTMYNLKPVGKHHVQVCTNLPCWLRGSDEIAATCKRVAGTEFGSTSEDGMFTLSEVECLGACVNAPMVQINDDYFEDLTSESAEEILNILRAGGTPKPGSQSGRHTSEPAGGLTSLKEGEDA